MEGYLTFFGDISIIGAGIGVLVGMYTTVFMRMNANTNTNVEASSQRVINTLTCVIRGELRAIKVPLHENPYDLFTRIYPTLKHMNNDQIQEFITILENYNENWITNDDDSELYLTED